MSHNDMANLLDVYQALDPDASTKSTTYILQFLWRDLTSCCWAILHQQQSHGEQIYTWCCAGCGENFPCIWHQHVCPSL